MRYEFLERKVVSGTDYQKAVETVRSVMEDTAGEKVSFLVYGSFLDDRLMPGVSDIDMVLFFWDRFVLDTNLLRTIGKELRNRFSCLRFDVGWFFDGSVIDLGTAEDGRFIPHNDNFSKIFEARDGDARLVYGKQFVQFMNPVTLVDPVEARIAYNLQSLRLYLLFGRCNYKWINGTNPFRELKVFQQIRSLGRKVMQLVDHGNISLAKDKNKSYQAMKHFFPAVDFAPLDDVETIFQNRDKVVDVLMNGQTLDLLFGSLECYEQMVQQIVKTLPMRSKRYEKGEVNVQRS